MNNDEKIKFLEEILNMINEKIQNNHKQIKNLNKMLIELKTENDKLLPKSNDIYAQIKDLRDSSQKELLMNYTAEISTNTLSKSSLFESVKPSEASLNLSFNHGNLYYGEGGSPNPYNMVSAGGGQLNSYNSIQNNLQNKQVKRVYSIPVEDMTIGDCELFLKKYKEDNNL